MVYRLLIFLVKLAINALALLLAARIFPKIWFDTQQATFIAALVLALVNSYLRPIVVILTLPINILTLGLFTLVISIVSCLLNLLLQPDRVQVRIHRA